MKGMEKQRQENAPPHPALSRGERVQTQATYTGERTDVTTYFSGKTDTYQRYRPGYPRAAMEAVLAGLGSAPLVADVGCGTGISSRCLAAAGARVIGIEPNDDMRAAATALGQGKGEPPIDYRAGTGEATGLPDHSLDCVVCAQAFHWFDGPRALREFHCILREGGRLALLWNKRDESDPASAEYERIISLAMDLAEETGRGVARYRSAPDLRPLFAQQSVDRYDNPVQYSMEDLLGRARSSSYWPESGEPRDRLEALLGALFNKHQEQGVLRIRQYTEVTLASRVRGS